MDTPLKTFSSNNTQSNKATLTGWIFLLLMSLLAFGFSGCGGGGGSGNTDNGEIIIGLTDAKGDFATYTVDVVSLTLTKSDDTIVETVPVNTRVDFAQYTDLTEFLTAAIVPNGSYKQGKMVLDYSNADIQVEDDQGNATKVDNIVDQQGDPVGQIEMVVQLENKNKLIVAPGVPSYLTLDFDLKQSNSVAFDNQDVPTVTVSPFLVAEVDKKAPKRHRVRGALQSVSEPSSSFHVFVHPFIHKIKNPTHNFGSIKVHSVDNTMYEINGQVFQGDAGLAELALQVDKTAVIVRGVIQFAPRRFVAKEVYAGSSVPFGDHDAVAGSVMARSGDVLTVRGATLYRADGKVEFSDKVLVSLADSTTVSKQLSMDMHTIDDISVGQRIVVFGTAGVDAEENNTLDASNGHARMRFSVVRGTVLGLVFAPETPPQYPFVLNAESINNRNISLYDFAGTGTDAGNDATGDFYEIDTGNLNTGPFVADSKVAVGGFPKAFGMAPADFTAQTIVSMPPIAEVIVNEPEAEVAQ